MFKKILSAVAPMIGGALGGPGGALAAKMLSSVLTPGNENPTEQELEEAYKHATPDQIVKLKQMDVEFAQIEAQDRANARDREIKTKDKMPATIGLITLSGLLAITILLFFDNVSGHNKDIIDLLIGAVIANSGQVYNYYFGSTRRRG